MKSQKLFITALCAASLAMLFGCGKQDKKQKAPVKQQVVEVVEPVKEEPQAEAPVERVYEEPAPKDDDAILSVALNDENLKTGQYLEAEIAISAPFANPFDRKDINVVMSVNGERNGVSENIRMYYAGGNAEKSVWRARLPLEKGGSYKCSFSVMAGGKSHLSYERSFKVEKGDQPKAFILGKKDFSHFKNASGQTMRGIGGVMRLDMDLEKQKEILKKLSEAGGNVVRISFEAPLDLFVAEDTESAKAGWINMDTVNKLEAVMDEAAKLGIYTVIDFASPASFTDEAYKNSYFYKSGIAKTPQDFFAQFPVQQIYNEGIGYAVARFGNRDDLLMWLPFSRIDSFDFENIASRAMWLNNIVSFLRNASDVSHPVMLTAGTSSDLDFLWADSCDFLGFDLESSRDYAQSVNFHNRIFLQKYKKPVGVSAFGFRDGAFDFADPSFIRMHNAVWAGLVSNSPLLPLVDLNNADSLEAALAAVRNAAAFEKEFKLAATDISLRRKQPDVVLQPAPRAADNAVAVQPAFSRTNPEREPSSEEAVIVFDGNSTLLTNSMPQIWSKGGTTRVTVKDVPNDKCSLYVDTIAMPKDEEFELVVKNPEEEVLLSEKFSGKAAKTSVDDGGVNKIALDKTIKIPLAQGDQTVLFELKSEGPAHLEIGTIKLEGIGSNNGLSNLTTYSVVDSSKRRLLWLKRGGTDTYTVGRYKLYNRGLLEQRSFDYSVPGLKENSPYKVTWWNTRTGEKIGSGNVKSDAEGTVKLKTPSFKNDVACVIEEI